MSWRETHPQRPNSCLGATKLSAEVLCNQFQAEHGLPTVRLRFTWVHAGPDFLTYQMRLPGMLGRAKSAAGRGMAGAAEAVAMPASAALVIEHLREDAQIAAARDFIRRTADQAGVPLR